MIATNGQGFRTLRSPALLFPTRCRAILTSMLNRRRYAQPISGRRVEHQLVVLTSPPSVLLSLSLVKGRGGGHRTGTGSFFSTWVRMALMEDFVRVTSIGGTNADGGAVTSFLLASYNGYPFRKQAWCRCTHSWCLTVHDMLSRGYFAL